MFLNLKICRTSLGPTLILLFICGVILHDKIIDWREKKEAEKALDSIDFSGGQEPDRRELDLKALLLNHLSRLPEGASYQQIRDAFHQAIIDTVPDKIIDRAIEVFGDRQTAARWLASEVIVLGGQSPVDVLHQSDGEETVLTILERIEYGVYS